MIIFTNFCGEITFLLNIFCPLPDDSIKETYLIIPQLKYQNLAFTLFLLSQERRGGERTSKGLDGIGVILGLYIRLEA